MNVLLLIFPLWSNVISGFPPLGISDPTRCYMSKPPDRLLRLKSSSGATIVYLIIIRRDGAHTLVFTRSYYKSVRNLVLAWKIIKNVLEIPCRIIIIIIINELLIAAAAFPHSKHALCQANCLICIRKTDHSKEPGNIAHHLAWAKSYSVQTLAVLSSVWVDKYCVLTKQTNKRTHASGHITVWWTPSYCSAGRWHRVLTADIHASFVVKPPIAFW